MLDIIIKLFGALGIVISCVHLFEWLFYRRMKGNGLLLVDLRGADEKRCLENLDLVATSLQKTCTRALISKAFVLTDENNVMKNIEIHQALKLLDLDMEIIIERKADYLDKSNNKSSQGSPTA